MTRFQPVVIVLAFVGLFAVAVLVGYVGGQAFLAPTTTITPRPPRPIAAPTPRPSLPSQLPPPGASAPTRPQPPPPVLIQPTPSGPATPAPGTPAKPSVQPAPPSSTPAPSVIYRVQVGAFLRRENAEARAAQLRQNGFEAYVNLSGGLYKVQVGAFADRANALEMAEQLKELGYEVLVTP